MKVSDLVVEVRDASLARVGQLLAKDLEGFTAVLRFNATGTWSLTLPTDHVLIDALRTPGAGIIVTGPSFSFSGPTNSAKRVQTIDDPEGTWEVTGVTDDVILGERLAYPTPTTADVTAQPNAYDVRTGKASTVLFGYVNANIGPSAPVATYSPGSVTRTNLVPNPSFETNATGWTATSATLTTTTAMAFSGNSSASLTANTTSVISIATPTGTSGIPVVAGQTYTFSGYVRSASQTGRQFNAAITWYNSAGTQLSVSTGGNVSVSTSAWVRPGLNATAPAGAAFASLKLASSTTVNAGTVWYVDGALFETPAGTKTYFDGSTTSGSGAGGNYYSWTGTAHASTSTLRPLVANNDARRISSLTLDTDSAIGSTITASARFETLGKLLTRLAAIDGLGFQLKQSGSNLLFSVYQPTDRSAYVRMDIENNLLTKSEYTYTAPGATRAIVAGQGAGAGRTFVEVSTTPSTTAETAWSRRIEVFRDQRSDSDTTALTQAGTEELADKGKTLEAVSVSPSDDVTMAFGTDWFLGDKVSVVVGSTSIVQVVTEVGLKISEDGVRIGATVGSPSAVDEESTVIETLDNQDSRITNLEANTSSASTLVTPNYVINGAMEINQRAFTTTTTNAIFMFDRWRTLRTQVADGSVTYTASTLNPGDISSPIPQGVITVTSSGQTLADARAAVLQRIEDVRTLNDQTVTVSFWAKAASGSPSMSVSFDQSFGTGGSPLVGVFIGKVTLSTTWTRYSVTGKIPSVAGKTITADSAGIALILWTSAGPNYNAGTGTLGFQSATISFTGVQVEEGWSPTTFRRNANSFQGEVAACQRYYEKSYDLSVAPGTITEAGLVGWRTTNVSTVTMVMAQTTTFRVSKRATPTVRTYGPYTGVIDKIWNNTADAAATVWGAGHAGFGAYYNASTVTNANLAYHWTAEAEL